MWLNAVLQVEALLGFWLSLGNSLLLLRMAPACRSRARLVAVATLTSVCAGQALEALLFLWLAPTASTLDAWSAAAMLLVRSALLGSNALVALLVLRSPR